MKSSSIVASCLAGIALISNPVNGETMTAEELEAHKDTFIQIDIRTDVSGGKATCAVQVDPMTAGMTAAQFAAATYDKAKTDTPIYISGGDNSTNAGLSAQANLKYLEGLGFTNVVNLGDYGADSVAINNQCNRKSWTTNCNYYHLDLRDATEIAAQGQPECAYGVNATELLTMTAQNIADEFYVDFNSTFRLSGSVAGDANLVQTHMEGLGYNVENNGGWGTYNNATDADFQQRFPLTAGCQGCRQLKYTPSDPADRLTNGYGYSSGKGGKGKGGVAKGGKAKGGKAKGGVATGGVAKGGKAKGGVATGGVAKGGKAKGGVATGGVAKGGKAKGGKAKGGKAKGGKGMAYSSVFIQLDVRSAADVLATGKASCAVNIDPLTSLMNATTFLAATNPLANFNTPIYVSCVAGVGSQKNIDYLKTLGFTNLINLGGWTIDSAAIIENCNRNSYTTTCTYVHWDVRDAATIAAQGKPECAEMVNATAVLAMSAYEITKTFKIAYNSSIRVSCMVGTAAQPVADHLFALGFASTNEGGWGYWNSELDYDFKQRFPLTAGCGGCNAANAYYTSGKKGKLSAFLHSDQASIAGGVFSGALLVAGVAAFAVRRRSSKLVSEESEPLVNQVSTV